MLIKEYLERGTEHTTFQSNSEYSQDWDSIKRWSDQVYLPFKVRPIGQIHDPTAYMARINIGKLLLTRFTYGIPVNIYNFSENASNVLLLTTIHGHARHAIDAQRSIMTGVNQSYIMDSSYPDDYGFFASEDNIQLNLTIPKSFLKELILVNFGYEAPPSLWKARTSFGDKNICWMALLNYVYQCLKEIPNQELQKKAGEHLQQIIGLHVINEWANREKINLNQPHDIAPSYVDRAEEFIRSSLQYSPTIAEIAQTVGVSIRTLSSSFKKYKHMTIGQQVRQLRLEKTRQLLIKADIHANVMDIAHACGYINLGDFARQYKQKYGELPSQTIKRK
ncbi:hypothetical protein B9T31_03845 [Acinetobacter sp. ANC 4558]|uniref:AraC family transcriptional regulator n=1 Tax=Acinetobacter sp. ANC 4558 TaxID=1977876 RepID=UPI000A33CD48|nr:AraC family transcriptional regulator [Acinetobacter sp. ANC 4558]OTG87641.1 hypothetical protein B9T31_03845 [Acinetobacter sp. ANC 4558]